MQNLNKSNQSTLFFISVLLKPTTLLTIFDKTSKAKEMLMLHKLAYSYQLAVSLAKRTENERIKIEITENRK